MQEHVGKRRRKEVREAIDMRHEMMTTLAVTCVALVVGIALAVAVQLLVVFGMLVSSNIFLRLLPAIVIFVLLLVVCGRAYKLSGLREEYKEHCRRYNITKEDMRALEHGEL